MRQPIIRAFFSFTILAVTQSSLAATQCQLAKNCQECMGRGPTCSWCFDDAFDDTAEGPGYRCADRDVLIDRNCPADKIESINSTFVDGNSHSLFLQNVA